MKKSSGLNQERNLHRSKTALNQYVAGFMTDLFLQTCSFSLFKTLTDGLEWCGLLWCFYQTLILTAPIHCRAHITETLRHISPNLTKKQTHLHLWCSEGEHISSSFSFAVFFKYLYHNFTFPVFCPGPPKLMSPKASVGSSLTCLCLSHCSPI